jgi:cysteine desulfurase
MRRIYLDHAATTPPDSEAMQAALEAVLRDFGNPSSGHIYGRRARDLLDDAADSLARSIGARRGEEILFTSGGTEADNLALRGVSALLPPEQAIAISTIEHAAIMDTAAQLEAGGRRIVRLPVNSRGLLELEGLAERLKAEKVGLLSLIWANNEIGSVQDMLSVAGLCKRLGILSHSDAVQALGKLPVRMDEVPLDMLTGSAHKFYGPKGSGFLYVKRGTRLEPAITGGLQQGGLRGGTENILGALAMAHSLETCIHAMEPEAERLRSLARFFLKELGEMDGLVVNSAGEDLPGHLSLSFNGIEGEALLLSLDLDGIAISSGSACHTGMIEPSHVLKAIGLSDSQAKGSIRLVCGRDTTQEDLTFSAGRIRDHVARLGGLL